MNCISTGSRLTWQHQNEKLVIEPWNENSLRIRCTLRGAGTANAYDALSPVPEQSSAKIEINKDNATIQNGSIIARISFAGTGRNENGVLHFYHATTGRELLAEQPGMHWPPARNLHHSGNSSVRIEYSLKSYADEKIYGMGQHTHGKLDQKGCVLDLVQMNTEVSIPFVLSSRGYGFLWNNPAIGQVVFGANKTRWVAESAQCLDCWITAGDTPREIMTAYMQAVGKPPMMPEWATGFWQCKLRYISQAEVLGVARAYHKRGLPLSVIVIDFFHWTKQGDWQFDPACFPDPSAMVDELTAMGTKLMVSIWPTVDRRSINYAEMKEKGLLVENENGIPAHLEMDGVQQFYDATNPEAREFIWEKVSKNYYRHGIKIWWLDACEPEIYPMDLANLRYSMGNGAQVSNIYPLMHEKAFFDGMQRMGEQDIVLVSRSAWVGSQKYGVAVWSGDIPSTFESLQQQLKAGLNMAMSGISWWNTDIGGFVGGDIESDYFRELIVRWFQYGVFCPLFRLHGARVHRQMEVGYVPNEVWSFGDVAYGIISRILMLREKLRPYIMSHMKIAHETGTPIMRPLFYDFPDDSHAFDIEDQFLFGSDILVAPVITQSTWSRTVYLPKGAAWTNAWTGAKFAGGAVISVAAALDEIPVFVREGCPVQSVFAEFKQNLLS